MNQTEGPQVGDTVQVGSRGHRMDGLTGTVSARGTYLGTIKVSFGGGSYGFLPSELTVMDPEPAAQDPRGESSRAPHT